MTIEAVLANEERWHVEVGDVCRGLSLLPAGCLQSVVTSPPYWRLRSYLPAGHSDKAIEIGSEPTPEAFIAKLVSIFREVRRVLRDDGTLWLNLGDNYADDTKWGGTTGGVHRKAVRGKTGIGRGKVKSGIVGQVLMPHRVAMAMQADGWNLRSTIIWAKRNPMCESLRGWRWRKCRVKVKGTGWTKATHPAYVNPDEYQRSHAMGTHGGKVSQPHAAKWQDCPGCAKCLPNNGYVLRRGSWRPTTAHEYIFLFTKGEGYFCDGDAAQEQAASDHSSGNKERKLADGEDRSRLNTHMGSSVPWQHNGTRNPRSVWTFGSEPEKAKHFATFPSALPRKCLQAATSSAGCCPKCGACYAPVVESERVATRPGENTKLAGPNSRMYQRRDIQRDEPYKAERYDADRLEVGNRDPQRHIAITKVTGYRPTCECNAGPAIPCLVADIFSGSGTTGRAAYSMGLRYLGFELSEEYAAISREKIVRPFKKGKPTPKHKRPMDGQKELFE